MAMELALASCDLYERRRPKLLHNQILLSLFPLRQAAPGSSLSSKSRWLPASTSCYIPPPRPLACWRLNAAVTLKVQHTEAAYWARMGRRGTGRLGCITCRCGATKVSILLHLANLCSSAGAPRPNQSPVVHFTTSSGGLLAAETQCVNKQRRQRGTASQFCRQMHMCKHRVPAWASQVPHRASAGLLGFEASCSRSSNGKRRPVYVTNEYTVPVYRTTCIA